MCRMASWLECEREIGHQLAGGVFARDRIKYGGGSNHYGRSTSGMITSGLKITR